MRQHRALGWLLGAAVLAAGAWGSCEDGAPVAPRAHAPRRVRAHPARPPRAWSSSAWIAPADGGFDLASSAFAPAPEDAGALDPATSELVESICGPLAASLCDARARCGCAYAPGCAQLERSRCESWLRCAYPGSDGTVAVDPRRVAACIARMASEHAHCLAPPPVETCYALLVDPAEEGERCHDEYAYSCLGGDCVDGRCESAPGIGERCDAECAEDAFCAASGRCRPLAELECSAGADCGPGHACVAGRCGTPRSEGEPCEADECAPRLACREGRCARVDRCERHRDCLAGDECAGAFTYRCVPAIEWPLGGLGRACTWGTCEEGLVCRGGECAGAPALGEPCPDRVCARGLACELGVCATRHLGPGALCSSYPDRCMPGLVCHHGDDGPRCRRARELGERCEGETCDHGLGCDAVFERGRCTPELCDAGRSDPWSCDVD